MGGIFGRFIIDKELDIGLQKLGVCNPHIRGYIKGLVIAMVTGLLDAGVTKNAAGHIDWPSVAMTSVTAGLLYLHKSPLPPEWDGEDRRDKPAEPCDTK